MLATPIAVCVSFVNVGFLNWRRGDQDDVWGLSFDQGMIDDGGKILLELCDRYILIMGQLFVGIVGSEPDGL